MSDQPPKLPNPLGLEESLDESEWSWLLPHLARDAVILVAHDVDLLLAARAISKDDKEQVQAWVSAGKLTKPTQLQIEAWTKTPTKKFLTLIVQPYVLAQEHLQN